MRSHIFVLRVIEKRTTSFRTHQRGMTCCLKKTSETIAMRWSQPNHGTVGGSGRAAFGDGCSRPSGSRWPRGKPNNDRFVQVPRCDDTVSYVSAYTHSLMFR